MQSKAFRFQARSFGRDLVYSWKITAKDYTASRGPFIKPWLEKEIAILGVEVMPFRPFTHLPTLYRWFMVGNSYCDDIMLMSDGRRCANFFPRAMAFGPKGYIDLHCHALPLLPADVFVNLYYEP